jgi:hypothetical protein
MFDILSRVHAFLTSPALPDQISSFAGCLEVLLIRIGIGTWGIIGAAKVFLYLIRFHR